MSIIGDTGSRTLQPSQSKPREKKRLFPEEEAVALEKRGWTRAYNKLGDFLGMQKQWKRFSAELRHYPIQEASFNLSLDFNYYDLPDLPGFNGDGEYAPVIDTGYAFKTIDELNTALQLAQRQIVDGLKTIITWALKEELIQ